MTVHVYRVPGVSQLDCPVAPSVRPHGLPFIANGGEDDRDLVGNTLKAHEAHGHPGSWNNKRPVKTSTTRYVLTNYMSWKQESSRLPQCFRIPYSPERRAWFWLETLLSSLTWQGQAPASHASTHASVPKCIAQDACYS